MVRDRMDRSTRRRRRRSLGQGELDGDDRVAVRFEVARAISVDRLLNGGTIGSRLTRISAPLSMRGWVAGTCRRYRCHQAGDHQSSECQSDQGVHMVFVFYKRE